MASPRHIAHGAGTQRIPQRCHGLPHGRARGCHMATVGVTQAAKMTGRDPSTIFRALRTGRLSYTKDEAGNRRIDIAELERLYPLVKRPDAEPTNGAIRAPARARTGTPAGEVEALRLLVAAKDEALRDLRARVDAIEARLDASEAERRQLSERLTGLLSHRQSGSVPVVQPAPARVPWWLRWLR